MACQLILVRHGQTPWNREERLQVRRRCRGASGGRRRRRRALAPAAALLLSALRAVPPRRATLTVKEFFSARARAGKAPVVSGPPAEASVRARATALTERALHFSSCRGSWSPAPGWTS